MSITAGEDILAADFISASAGAGSSGKGVKLNASGVLDLSFFGVRFGGSGSDGALSVSSGATNTDLGSAEVVVKNYTSISITGTGYITFTNPHANGTIIVWRSQGNITITSTATRAIDLRLLGGSIGTNGTGVIIRSNKGDSGHAGSGSVNNSATTAGPDAITTLLTTAFYTIPISCGAGGGNGGSGTVGTAGAGGCGGGSMFMECAGAYNFGASSTIDYSGTNGVNAVAGTEGAGQTGSGGGGGGAGGIFACFYETLTANAGTYTKTGGDGGNSGIGGTPTGSGDRSAGGGGCGGGHRYAGGDGGAGAGQTGGGSGTGAAGGDGDGTGGGTGGTGGRSSKLDGGGGGGGAAGDNLVTANTNF